MALSKEQPNQEDLLVSSQSELPPKEPPMEELVDLLLELQEEKKAQSPNSMSDLKKETNSQRQAELWSMLENAVNQQEKVSSSQLESPRDGDEEEVEGVSSQDSSSEEINLENPNPPLIESQELEEEDEGKTEDIVTASTKSTLKEPSNNSKTENNQAKLEDNPLQPETKTTSFTFPEWLESSPEEHPSRTLSSIWDDLQELLAKSGKTKLPRKSQTHRSLSIRESIEQERLRQSVEELEDKFTQVEHQADKTTEILNNIVPLMVELLKTQLSESQDQILGNMVPIIDKVIQERSSQNRGAMSAAIADILPGAISKQIQDSPDEIAKALAPEIAAAIREQSKLQQNAISEALGPEMGKAIRAQIAYEREAMVDALYPVIGSTVSKYMGEVVSSINEKVEHTLSPQGVMRKVRAKVQGVSDAELILLESVGFTVKAVFLIQTTSGLVIEKAQPSGNERLEADMLAGMLTAIRGFVNDCIVQSGDISELSEIEYGNSRVILEPAGYCYLAVVVKGQHSDTFIKKMRLTMGRINQKYSNEVKNFAGDPTTVPDEIQLLLEELMELAPGEKAAEPETEKRSPQGLLKLALLLLFLLAMPWGFYLYRANVAERVETETTAAIDKSPELYFASITPKFKGNKLILTGRVPNPELREKATEIVQAKNPDIQITNQIVAVDVPPELADTAVELKTALLSGQPGLEITSNYEDRTVTVEGTVEKAKDIPRIVKELEEIAGVKSVNVEHLKLKALEGRIYFELGSSVIKPQYKSEFVVPIKEFLEINPKAKLEITGHVDRTGGEQENKELARDRAKAVKQALEEQGVDPKRIITSGTIKIPPNVAPEQPMWLSRCVRFNLFSPPGKSNQK